MKKHDCYISKIALTRDTPLSPEALLLAWLPRQNNEYLNGRRQWEKLKLMARDRESLNQAGRRENKKVILLNSVH